MSDPAHLYLVPPLRGPSRGQHAWLIPRRAAELPDDARVAVERAVAPPRGGAYRTHDSGGNVGTAWYPVALREPPAGGRALLWPAVRTAVPAGASAALLGSLVVLAGTLDPVGVVGTALGGVLGAVVARTQYKLERDQHALGALWLAADYSRVLVGRYDSLAARLTGRARWYVLPLDALAGDDPPSRRADAPRTEDDAVLRPWYRWHVRAHRVGQALSALGIDGATVDMATAERVHTLARLARFRRFARGAT